MYLRLALAVVSMLLAASPMVVLSQASKFTITYPKENAMVQGKTIVLRGQGVESGATLEGSVLTNDLYKQDRAKATINQDGSWTFGPVYLDGMGEFNNHTIQVTVIRMVNGKLQRGDTATVGGIVRK